jgi:signal transduction histidine kinase
MDTVKIKILILEDQVDDEVLIKRAIGKGGIVFDSQRVDDQPAFEKAIQNFTPDIILSDHSLPQFNSIEALKICRKAIPDIPFILVTGAVSDEFAAQCIKLGADDYILKSNLTRLPSSIKSALEHRMLIRKRREGEEALRLQNQQLIKVNTEIDSFVYSVSHNLRAPISSVLGLVNVARSESKSGTLNALDYLDLIEKSVLKLDETIKEILLYAQNERMEVQRERVHLKFLINDNLEKFRFLRHFDEIDKQINCDDEVPLYTDSFRVNIVIINLLSNAFKYFDENKEFPLIRIKSKVDNLKAVIEVTDNGIGIHPARVSSIFKMFFRGTDKSDGAGLGLYIAKLVVEKLQGTIEVSSQPEMLTTFKVTIPNQTLSS